MKVKLLRQAELTSSRNKVYYYLLRIFADAVVKLMEAEAELIGDMETIKFDCIEKSGLEGCRMQIFIDISEDNKRALEILDDLRKHGFYVRLYREGE